MTRLLALATTILLASPAFFTDATAQQLSTIGGDVTTSTGAPLPRARVMVLTADQSDTLTVLFTDAAGRYEDQLDTSVGVDEPRGVAAGTELAIAAIYPNPVAGGGSTVNIRYATRTAGEEAPTVELFDVLGRLLPEDSRIAAGLYFVRLRTSGERVSPTRTLVVTASGPVRFVMSREEAPTVAASELAAGKSAASGRVATLVRVEKDGYVTEEASAEINASSPTELDFELNDAATPTASFTVSGTLEVGGAAVFDATASTGANAEDLTYAWSFGDALMGGGAEIAHVYTAASTYDVTLTVTGDYGARSSVTQQVGIAGGPPPLNSNGTLTGIVSDISGFALADVTASIVGTGQTGVTNPFGMLEMGGVDVGVPLVVRLSRPGYSSQVVQVGVLADTTTTLFFDTAMRPRDAAIEVPEAEDGFMKRARDGVMVELPPDALMRADGEMASGAVSLSMTPVDVADPEEVRSFPGRFEGLQPDGSSALLLSLGTAEFTFEQGGEELQLAPGKTATIEIPIYTSEAAIGEEIPLWSMNETTGAWVQEGVGTVAESSSSPSGLALVAQVGHFSWWNIDKPDFEPDEAEGLCFKWECFNGICNKVKVYCWVEGAIKGDLDKRGLLDPPVFTARKFFPAEGSTVLLPANREVVLRGTVVQDSVLLRGDTSFVAVPNGSSQFELVLDTAFVTSVNRVGIPFDTTDAFMQGEFHLYEFQGRASQVVAFSGQRITGSGFPANIELLDSLGTVLASRVADSDVRVAQLPDDGLYRFRVTATAAGESSYRLRVETVSGGMQVNSNFELRLGPQDFRILQFDPGQAEMLLIGSEAPEGRIRMKSQIWDSQLNGVGGTIRDPDSGPFEPGVGVHYTIIQALPAATDSTVRVGLSEVFPDDPVHINFDSNGHGQATTAMNYHGQRRYFTFDAETDEGFELALYRTDTSEAVDALFKLFYPAGNQVPSVTPQSGWNDEIILGWGTALQASGRYRLTVSDERFNTIGGFEVRLSRVAPSNSIIVDDDLACAGATTSSVSAALHAITDGGTVTLCDGVHVSPSRPTLLRDDATFTGESREGTILQFTDINRFPGSILDAQGRNMTVSNMTMQTDPKPNQANLGIRSTNSIDGNTALFEDLTFRPITPGNIMGVAIEGTYEAVVIRDIDYESGGLSGRSIDLRISESALIEGGTYNATINASRTGSDNFEIDIDGVTTTFGGISIQNVARGSIRNNQIDGQIAVTISDSVEIVNNVISNSSTVSFDAIRVQQTATSLIEGNVMDRKIDVSVGEGDRSIIARNRINLGDETEVVTLSHVFNENGGTLQMLNNIVEGKRSTTGNLRIFYADLFAELLVANNTILPEQAGNSAEFVPTVLMTLRDQAFTGDLPVTFVNNIFVGDATTVFSTPANTTIDADYNLYHNYNVLVTGGGIRTGTNDLFGSDPLLTGADFQPQNGSPAIDSGATPSQYSGVPAVDYAGTARPQGVGYDRGAWEQ